MPASLKTEFLGQSFENPFDYFMADAQITSKAPVTLRAIQFIEIFQKF